MRLAAIGFAALLFLSLAALYPGSNSRAITGKVTYTGTPAKPKIYRYVQTAGMCKIESRRARDRRCGYRSR